MKCGRVSNKALPKRSAGPAVRRVTLAGKGLYITEVMTCVRGTPESQCTAVCDSDCGAGPGALGMRCGTGAGSHIQRE